MKNTDSMVETATDSDYKLFELSLENTIAGLQHPLFLTDAVDLFAEYLAGIPEDYRQHYNCHCCRRFINKYGGLVRIFENGIVLPALWDANTTGFFEVAVLKMIKKISLAKVVGVFINDQAVWGNPVTGNWTHLSGKPSLMHHHATLSASQVEAEKKQDYIMLKKALNDYPQEAVIQAVRVLEADVVDRSEKTLGIAKWFLNLHEKIDLLKGYKYNNLVWMAVAMAPPGWCHISNTMINTLLDDVITGLPFEDIKARWNAKMHPLRYQRPQAAPKSGAIEQAEKLVATLGSAGSFDRRFARFDEVVQYALWTPKEVHVPPSDNASGKIFNHLKEKQVIKQVMLPSKSMEWNEFLLNVLPTANSIEVNVPIRGGFCGLITAVNPEAPPILQWDGLEGKPRNPVSWYFWHGGSSASQWGLTTGWNKVAAIIEKPSRWQSNKFEHQGNGIIFMIRQARESIVQGAAIFPENLKSEYHGIRSVIEAHSKSLGIAGKEEGDANGIAVGDGLTVRVNGQDYQIRM